jgi:hypothetical protein
MIIWIIFHSLSFVKNNYFRPPVLPPAHGDHVALFDYEKQSGEDMSMRKGDKLIVVEKTSDDWWLMKNLRTNITGHVPANFITDLDGLSSRE